MDVTPPATSSPISVPQSILASAGVHPLDGLHAIGLNEELRSRKLILLSVSSSNPDSNEKEWFLMSTEAYVFDTVLLRQVSELEGTIGEIERYGGGFLTIDRKNPLDPKLILHGRPGFGLVGDNHIQHLRNLLRQKFPGWKFERRLPKG